MRRIGTKKRKKRNTIPNQKTMRRANANRVRLSVHDHLLGGALRATTQMTEVTAPIRLTTPTIPELNLMAEELETESANHRQLVSRIRGTSRNLTSLSSLHSPRHNCGALGVLRTSRTSKGPLTPRKTRYLNTCCCAIGLNMSTRSGNSGVFRQA